MSLFSFHQAGVQFFKEWITLSTADKWLYNMANSARWTKYCGEIGYPSGGIRLSGPPGIARCISQENVPCMPYNKSLTNKTFPVKISGWSRSFLPVSRSRLRLGPKHAKKTWPIFSHLDLVLRMRFLTKIQNWILKSERFRKRILRFTSKQILSDHGASKQPNNPLWLLDS